SSSHSDLLRSPRASRSTGLSRSARKALRYDALEPELARLAKHDVVSRMSNLRARLQMPNTINATNPMPTNSITSATKSYSSQCRLRMMFIPVQIDLCLGCENRWALTSIFDGDQKIVACGQNMCP